VRFLVDENLSPRLVDLLAKAGHDTVHVRDLEATGFSDSAVIALAVADDRVIISADTDFGALLAYSRATQPSVILVRAIVDRRPPELAAIIIANLAVLEEHLKSGAIAAFTASDIRVRSLPLR
jgi:predicted nuclease of predicted toxin-antitoxin system